MLEIKYVKKDYRNFSLNCSLNVKKGRITGLVGQNGAGKSTAFKAALGLISFNGGSITVLGKDIKDFSPKDKEKIGVVLSDSGFSGFLTVNDVNSIMKNLYTEFDSESFTRKAEKYGLPLDKKIKEFSTGMKAKLKLLTAVSHNAKLLLLDEPTAGLDVVARDELLLMLREYMEQDEERAILISSHISSDLETICDDLYMIHEGTIIFHEDTDVLLSGYALIKADREQYEKLDKQYICCCKEEAYGYCCLTNQRQFYMENYPQLIIEKCTIDSMITMMLKGERK